MGFHKRWITEHNILDIYKRKHDIEDVCDYMSADALIVEMGFASEIVDLINKDMLKEAADILEERILNEKN